MFRVSILNKITNEVILEKAKNASEVDEIVESMHNIYGDNLDINVAKDEDEITTRPFNPNPEDVVIDLSVEDIEIDVSEFND